MGNDAVPSQVDWCHVAAQLQHDPEALPWREREALFSDNFLAFSAPSEEMLATLDVLAGDSKWEVRRRVAELLAVLPDEAFNRLAARLTDDQNSYVRKAAGRSMDRRRKGQQVSSRRRQMLGGVADDYELMEKLHGALATKMSRQIAERLYDVLVGATIHNMRGLLTPVCSSAQSLLNKVIDGRIDASDLRKHLKRIVDATGDLSHLLEEVRRYSQQVSRERTRERLQSLVAESLENAKACFSQTGHDVELISLRIEVPAEITVEVSKVHLVVALTNLLQNSFEAFKPVMDQVGPFWIAVSAHADDAGDVTVTIEDNGIGFGEDDLRQIRQFIPGQTTLKHDGTGFGLPTAKRYIEGHGGSLEIDSQEHQGTQVRIRLPLLDDEE